MAQLAEIIESLPPDAWRRVIGWLCARYLYDYEARIRAREEPAP